MKYILLAFFILTMTGGCGDDGCTGEHCNNRGTCATADEWLEACEAECEDGFCTDVYSEKSYQDCLGECNQMRDNCAWEKRLDYIEIQHTFESCL